MAADVGKIAKSHGNTCPGSRNQIRAPSTRFEQPWVSYTDTQAEKDQFSLIVGAFPI